MTVGHRRKNVRDTKKVTEDPSKYRSLPMVEERVHVQRLAVLQHLDPEQVLPVPCSVTLTNPKDAVGDDNVCLPVLLTLPPGHPDDGDDNACQPEDGDDNNCLFA